MTSTLLPERALNELLSPSFLSRYTFRPKRHNKAVHCMPALFSYFPVCSWLNLAYNPAPRVNSFIHINAVVSKNPLSQFIGCHSENLISRFLSFLGQRLSPRWNMWCPTKNVHPLHWANPSSHRGIRRPWPEAHRFDLSGWISGSGYSYSHGMENLSRQWVVSSGRWSSSVDFPS